MHFDQEPSIFARFSDNISIFFSTFYYGFILPSAFYIITLKFS